MEEDNIRSQGLQPAIALEEEGRRTERKEEEGKWRRRGRGGG
jgi:hypothetical protein